MRTSIKIMEWNANGLQQHKDELQVILEKEDIDICLICETHFTNQSFITFKNYCFYHTFHPSNNARGGSAILIKRTIDHYEDDKISLDVFQATTVTCKINNSFISFTSVYSPPRHNIKSEQYKQLIRKHKYKFIMGGDFNAKHVLWGSRLTTTKGRELCKALQETGCDFESTGKPTYWPTDPAKTPDLIDFFITQKVSKVYLEIKEGFDLNSDHSPIYLTFYCNIHKNVPPPTLTNKHTDWNHYRTFIKANINTQTQIHSTEELENEVIKFTTLLQTAAWNSKPELSISHNQKSYPPSIIDLVKKKRKIRQKWHQTRSPQDKNLLNNATQTLSRAISKFTNENLEKHLENLTYDSKTEYSLWKATKYLKRPITQASAIRTVDGNWAKSNQEKVQVFAKYLTSIFSNESQNSEELEEITNTLDVDIQNFTITEVKKEIKHLKSKKSPGYDLIVGEVLKHLPHRAIAKLTSLYNAAIHYKYIPSVWKVAEIKMILKPGKNPTEPSSYRPISLLPVIGKLFEKVLSKRLNLFIKQRNIIPSHQFGFRQQHSTIEQIHRITHAIEDCIEKKEISTAVFLDVSKAFDGVWHKGLLYKLNKLLPKQYCQILESYLENRFYRVKLEDEFSSLYPITSGVPQGSILGPLLYLIFTYDLPVNENCTVGTFADDTVVMASGKNVETSTAKLQSALMDIERWTKKWQIKINSSKSSHTNFTNKNVTHKPLYIGQTEIPFANTAKYLGMTLDVKLHWKEHVKKKREELEIKLRKMKWLIGSQSKLSIHNKLMLYKQILKPVWTYGIQIWGCAKNNVIKIIQKFQNKVLRTILNAPWYVRNSDIHRDLKINTVEEEIQAKANDHMQRLRIHTNEEIPVLLNTSVLVRRLNRTKPHDLITRFIQ